MISQGGKGAVALTRHEICEACGDTRCHECTISFLHKGVTGLLSRCYIKNKEVIKIEAINPRSPLTNKILHSTFEELRRHNEPALDPKV